MTEYWGISGDYYLALTICSDICPWTLSVPRSSVFFFFELITLVIVYEYTAVAGTPDVGEDVVKEVAATVDREEESSCTRLLAAAAERVWDIFLQNKREVGKFPFLLFICYKVRHR